MRAFKNEIKTVAKLNNYWKGLISSPEGPENVQINCRLHVCDCVLRVHALSCLSCVRGIVTPVRSASLPCVHVARRMQHSSSFTSKFRRIQPGGFSLVEECVSGPALACCGLHFLTQTKMCLARTNPSTQEFAVFSSPCFAPSLLALSVASLFLSLSLSLFQSLWCWRGTSPACVCERWVGGAYTNTAAGWDWLLPLRTRCFDEQNGCCELNICFQCLACRVKFQGQLRA